MLGDSDFVSFGCTLAQTAYMPVSGKSGIEATLMGRGKFWLGAFAGNRIGVHRRASAVP
jgi:hypothetical protein